ncbi:uncharacterized protein LOC125045508 isoform X1 [Penaeus chinensis]|uniref:uncharacterized protein LOC125045508 isoform X1 n=1 Tax=Penaeus chinensis TaxID=139456 RepID=UPI001FB771C6|nr:uncharacterized protein LOC125045508 isoform X1 [Penaeus chinensis]
MMTPRPLHVLVLTTVLISVAFGRDGNLVSVTSPARLPGDGAALPDKGRREVTPTVILGRTGVPVEVTHEVTDGILVFDNPIIDNPTNSENVQAAEDCVLKERGLLTPDGRVDPEPFLERLILALNVTRPDIVNRVSYAVTSCPLENFGEWETCIVSECLQKDPAMPVPTTIDPEE